MQGPIGVFDSGMGGLTILRALRHALPQYDYCYLGDNARTPYGTRSFETVYRYTQEAVQWLFAQGCPLVIVACNTASAKALRSIQQNDLPQWDPTRRVLGVIRPTAEIVGPRTQTGHIGIVATQGTVLSDSYTLEIAKFFPELVVHSMACPMWVPLVENGHHNDDGALYFVSLYLQQLLQRAPHIDTLLLGCTHYPLLMPLIQQVLPDHIRLIEQGPVVAQSLCDYLQRHPEIAARLLKQADQGTCAFYTTDDVLSFEHKAAMFLGETIKAKHAEL